MVIATMLGLSISLIPCLMFGVIIVISFLLCNCEYIGETLAKRFCAWKNRRKDRLKSKRTTAPSLDPNNGARRRKSQQGNIIQGCQSSSADLVHRNSANLSQVNFENHIAEPASAPVLDGANNENISNDDDFTFSDPPPSYEECVKTDKSLLSEKSESDD